MASPPIQPERPPVAMRATPGERARASASLVLRGVTLNFVLAALKIGGGIWGNTYALIADGVESLLDVFTSVLVWGGFRLAAQPADEDHPYGHGKAEAVASAVVAVTIFFASGWIAVHAVDGIRHPGVAPRPATLVLLGVVIIVKEAFSRRLHDAGRELGASALGAEAWHQRADALTSLAAFVGIALALAGGRGWEAADDWAALVASAVIFGTGLAVARRAFDEVMDTAAPAEIVSQVRACAATVPGVHAIEKCRVLKSGLSWRVDIHVIVDGALTVRAGHTIAHAVQDALCACPLGVTAVSVHIEPTRESAAPAPDLVP